MSNTVKIYQWTLERIVSYDKFVVKKKIIESNERAKTYKAVKGFYAGYTVTFNKDNLDKCYEHFSALTYSSLVDDDTIAVDTLRDEMDKIYSDKITRLEKIVESLYKELNILRKEEIEVKND